MLAKMFKVLLSILLGGLLILFVGFVVLMTWNLFVLKPRYADIQSAQIDIKILGNAVEMYRTGSGTLPPSLQALVPEHLRKVRDDPWGNPYVYRAYADRFSLASHGADKQAGTEDDLVMDVPLDGGQHIREWAP